MLTYSDDGGFNWSIIELDPELIIPEAIFMSKNGIPIILGYDGQLWSKKKTKDISWDKWYKLGKPNPEAIGMTAITTDGIIYVAGEKNIWATDDRGDSWNSFPIQDIVSFACEKNTVWSITLNGVLYKTTDFNTWSKIVKIPKIGIPFGIAVKNGRVFVAAMKEDTKAYGPIVEKDLSITITEGLNGGQAYSVRIDPKGRLWLVAQGLYRYEKGEWKQIWPIE